MNGARNSRKKRKVIDGPMRNRKRTEEKLIRAVGKILAKEGYTGLNTVKIAQTARVDRKLIYNYFGSLEKLIETYFKENDFWEPSYNTYIAGLLQVHKHLQMEDVVVILKGQMENMLANKAFQRTIQWEVSEKSRVMRKVADERERVGEALFSLMDEQSDGHYNDLRAILALQIAGIYYLTLHAKVNGSTFCGIDINLPAGRQRIEKALEQIMKNTFNLR